MAQFHAACKSEEVIEGEGKTVNVAGKLVALFRDAGKCHAIDDVCPHMGASLSAGLVEDGIVTCPWHAWRFRICDGVWADSPRVKIGSYPVKEENGIVLVEL